MVTIFVCHAPEDEKYAEHISTGLEKRGYCSLREPIPSAFAHAKMKRAILRAATIVLIWSSDAARSEQVEAQVLLAQQLKKQIVPVLTDSTPIPPTQGALSPIAHSVWSLESMTQLAGRLPPATSTDALYTLSERATHTRYPERKAAIEQAEEMLHRDEQREEVLALLNYLARNDPIDGVRQRAKDVLNADAGKSPICTDPDEERHFFTMRCAEGHVSRFDKRDVCRRTKQIVRDFVKHKDELSLNCLTCGKPLVALVDCEEYKNET